MGKGQQWLFLMGINNCTTVMFFGPKTPQSCTSMKIIERSYPLILLKKSGVLKSKEGRAQTVVPNTPISCEKKQCCRPSQQKLYLRYCWLMIMKRDQYRHLTLQKHISTDNSLMIIFSQEIGGWIFGHYVQGESRV